MFVFKTSVLMECLGVIDETYSVTDPNVEMLITAHHKSKQHKRITMTAIIGYVYCGFFLYAKNTYIYGMTRSSDDKSMLTANRRMTNPISP
jgi:hypothetical protein